MIRKTRIVILLVLLAASATVVWAAMTPHREYAGMSIKECNSCHKSSGVGASHTFNWLGEHRLIADKRPNNCKDCHQQAFCMECHYGGGIDPDLHASNSGPDYMPRSHRSDWNKIHPIKAFDDPRSCTRCHDEVKFCDSCHSKVDLRPGKELRFVSHKSGSFDPLGHSREAKRNLLACQSCHPDGDVCLNCHSAKLGLMINPHPRDWDDIRGNLERASNKRSCFVCH